MVSVLYGVQTTGFVVFHLVCSMFVTADEHRISFVTSWWLPYYTQLVPVRPHWRCRRQVIYFEREFEAR